MDAEKVKAYVGRIWSTQPGRFLFGGVRVHMSTPFETQDLAERWCRASVAINEGAGNPCKWTVWTTWCPPERIITKTEVNGDSA